LSSIINHVANRERRTLFQNETLRRWNYEGTVLLDVVVNTDGHAGQIIVLKGPGLGLEENSIKAVKKWKFKPARGPDGNPAPVIVQIEVTFHL
jgi:protein TonB